MHHPFPPAAISIGASDSSGGSGVQADIKTFTALNCYGASVITAVTAQGFGGVKAVHAMPDQLIRAQLDAVAHDLPITAVKVGLCPSASAMRVVARWIREHPNLPVVVDPVAFDAAGVALLQPEVVEVLRKELLPRATLVTPNRHEAALLAGMDEVLTSEDMEEAGRRIQKAHGCAVVVTGGGASGRSLDVLVALDGVRHVESAAANRTKIRGAGCAHSAAIAAQLAKGDSLREALTTAKAYVAAAYFAAATLPDGRGVVWHGVTVDDSTVVPTV